MTSNTSPLDFFIDILKRPDVPTWGVGQCFSHLVASDPRGCCQALRVYLDTRFTHLMESQPRSIEDTGANDGLFIKTYRLRDAFEKIFEPYPLLMVINQAAESSPVAFVEQLLPWFIRVITVQQDSEPVREDRYLHDSLFSFELFQAYSPRVHGREEPTFTESLISALKAIAKTNPSAFRDTSTRLANIETEAAQNVLSRAYVTHAEEYADDIYTYLTTDLRRLNIGDNHYDACLLVGSVFSYLTVDQRTHLEDIILSLKPAWELRSRGYGYTQTLFLKSIDQTLLSRTAQQRLQELERKFSEVVPKPHAMETRVGAVVSPIAPTIVDHMSDEHILGAMREYDETTGWDVPRSERRRKADDFFKGGLVEFSRVIGEKAKEQPERFYHLALKFDDTIATAYITQILDGLAESDAPATWLFEVAERFAYRFTEHERTGYCRALQKRSEDTVPDHLLDIMEEWAIEDDDPEPTRIPHGGHEWISLGINSVRGVAVEALMQCCLKGIPQRADRAFAFLEKMVEDPSPAVGACVLQSLLPLLRDGELEYALNLCEVVLERHPALLEDMFTYRFLSWATFNFYERFGQHIETMLISSLEHTRQEGARLATQAALKNQEAEELAARARSGDVIARRGAAHTYAMYLRNPEWQPVCEQHIRAFMYDEDAEVLSQVAFAFTYLKSEDITSLRDFVVAFIQSPALKRETRYIIDFVKPLATDEHELALGLTRAVLQAIENQDIKEFWDDDLVSLPLTVYNRSRDAQIKNQAIDLFERSLQLGVRGAKKALGDWDEHRDWGRLLYKT